MHNPSSWNLPISIIGQCCKAFLAYHFHLSKASAKIRRLFHSAKNYFATAKSNSPGFGDLAKREEPRSVGPRLGSLPPPADALQSFGSLVHPAAEGLEVAAVVAVFADNDLKAINAYQAFLAWGCHQEPAKSSNMTEKMYICNDKQKRRRRHRSKQRVWFQFIETSIPNKLRQTKIRALIQSKPKSVATAGGWQPKTVDNY